MLYRDTPHHLKNKRVQHNINNKKDHEILANAMQQETTKKQTQPLSTVVQSPIAENPSAEQSEQETEANANNGFPTQYQKPFEAPLSPIAPPAPPPPVMVTSPALPTQNPSHPVAHVTDGEY